MKFEIKYVKNGYLYLRFGFNSISEYYFPIKLRQTVQRNLNYNRECL